MTATPIPLFDDFDDSEQPKPPSRSKPRRSAQPAGDTTVSAEPDQLLTVKEAAAILGIGRSKLYELIARRAIASVKVDRCRRFRRSDIDRFIRDLHATSPN